MCVCMYICMSVYIYIHIYIYIYVIVLAIMCCMRVGMGGVEGWGDEQTHKKLCTNLDSHRIFLLQATITTVTNTLTNPLQFLLHPFMLKRL